MKQRINIIFFVCCFTYALLLSGCASSSPWMSNKPGLPGKIPVGEIPNEYNMEVYSLSAPDAQSKGRNYVIASAIKDVSAYDLEFMRVAAMIENALSEKGYKRVADEKDADLLVRLGYGLGEQQTSTHTYTTQLGYSYSVGWMWYTTAPETKTQTVVKYTRNIDIEAYGLKDPKRQVQLWKTTVKSVGLQSDLRIVLPYMIGASKQKFFTNMTQPEIISVLGYNNQIIDKKEYVPQDPFTPQPQVRYGM